MRTKSVRTVAAVLVTLAVGAGVTACGDEGGSPLDSVKAFETPSGPAADHPTDGPTDRPTKTPRRSTPPSTSAGGGTNRPASGSTAAFIADPCRLLTVPEAISLTGLTEITRSELDTKLKTSDSSFCDFRDASGISLITFMVTTADKSIYQAAEAAKSTIDDEDDPVPIAGVGDAAFTYRDDGDNGIVWAKAMDDKYLAVDLYIARSDKDVPPDVMASIARTMIGKL